MTRQQSRTPKTSDQAQALHRLADVIEHAVETIAAPALAAAPAPEVEQAQVVATSARYLGLRNLGDWIEIPGRHSTPLQRTEPSMLTTAGVLVGIRPGEPGRGEQPPTRVLVIAQGGQIAPHSVRVDEPVNTYPRAQR